MRLHVRADVRTTCKGLAAVRTSERFFPGMRAHVALQQPRSREGFAAHTALVVEVVLEDVHGERWHADVSLSTHVAAARIARVQGTMGLFVSRQIGRSRVLLSAFGAGVACFLGIFYNLSFGSSVAEKKMPCMYMR